MDGKNIEIAKKKYSAPNVEYLIGDATKDLPNQKFDVIILSNVENKKFGSKNFNQGANDKQRLDHFIQKRIRS